MQLFDSAFSPFARKVRLVLEWKGLDVDVVDGLDRSNHSALAAQNPRGEVPALVDGGVCVVNSADIVAYLEQAYPDAPSLYVGDVKVQAHVRAWERCADTVIDAILTDISYWMWADRQDTMPAGLLDAARADLAQIYAALNSTLEGQDYIGGKLSIADIALWPHLSAVRLMGVNFSEDEHPNVLRWFKRMRKHPQCIADLNRARAFMADGANMNVERTKLFWRGDRIEWLLARGQHAWFAGEIAAGRVLWPGLGIPAPLTR